MSGNIIINKKFNIPNRIDFSFTAKARPIMPIILQINKLVRPVGLKFVKFSKKSTGSKKDIIKTPMPIKNKYLLILFLIRPFSFFEIILFELNL